MKRDGVSWGLGCSCLLSSSRTQPISVSKLEENNRNPHCPTGLSSGFDLLFNLPEIVYISQFVRKQGSSWLIPSLPAPEFGHSVIQSNTKRLVSCKGKENHNPYWKASLSYQEISLWMNKELCYLWFKKMGWVLSIISG